jgi:hypothetical protein
MLNDTFKRDQNNASNRESLEHFKISYTVRPICG